ncbi:MAG: uroporphyrinogen-III C-methyltransferase [Dehalococcoidia bacterium]
MMDRSTPGKAFLVGAGPGDPGLVTLRAVEVLGRADVVLYDRLANEQLLDHAPAAAQRVYVGKIPGRHAMTQDEINAELVRLGLEGRQVVRLKGGDPFVFGRGGEEAATLAAAGVPFEVVPGVTSAIAGPAFAGIPVTDRTAASSFAVVTGHEDPARDAPRVDWAALAKGPDTLVILMGIGNLAATADRLIAGGRPGATPAALIEQATTPRQRTLVGTLSTIARVAAEQHATSPAVVVVGEVVRLRPRLDWFESRPLFGKSVLVTRTRQHVSVLRRMLEERGAEVVELPALEIVESASPEMTRRIGEALDGGEYAWTVFTSANGVNIFFSRLREDRRDARVFHGCSICAIGPGTAAALAEHGIVADLVPHEYVAEGVLAAMSARDLHRRRVLVPRAENARPELIAGLRALGAEVEEVPLYVSRPPESPDESTLSRARAGVIDIVTFASSSTVTHLVQMLGGDPAPLAGALVACIGPVTAKTARRLGIRVDVVAEEYSIPGLVAALEQRVAAGFAAAESTDGSTDHD